MRCAFVGGSAEFMSPKGQNSARNLSPPARTNNEFFFTFSRDWIFTSAICKSGESEVQLESQTLSLLPLVEEPDVLLDVGLWARRTGRRFCTGPERLQKETLGRLPGSSAQWQSASLVERVACPFSYLCIFFLFLIFALSVSLRSNSIKCILISGTLLTALSFSPRSFSRC